MKLSKLKSKLHSKAQPLAVMGLRLLTLGSKFLLTLFLARFLGLEALGIYGFILGATAVVPIVVSFGLMSVIGRDIVKLKPAAVIAEVQPYWLLILAVYAVLAPLAFFLPIGQGVLAGSFLLASLAVVMLEHLGTDTYNILVNLRRPLLANVLLFIRGGGWMLLYMPLSLLLPELLNLPTLLTFWLAGLVLAFAGFFLGTRNWPWKSFFTLAPTLQWYKMRIAHAWKFFFSDICSFGGPYLDRYIIGLSFGLKEAGIYVLFWSIANALYTLISTGVMQINRPRLISAHEDADHATYKAVYEETQSQAQYAALAFGIGAAVTFPFLLPYLHKPEALAALPVFLLLMAGLTVRTAADVAATGLYTRRQDNALVLTNLVGFALTAACNLALIPVFGLMGASFAFILSYGLLFAIRTRNLRFNPLV